MKEEVLYMLYLDLSQRGRIAKNYNNPNILISLAASTVVEDSYRVSLKKIYLISSPKMFYTFNC